MTIQSENILQEKGNPNLAKETELAKPSGKENRQKMKLESNQLVSLLVQREKSSATVDQSENERCLESHA